MRSPARCGPPRGGFNSTVSIRGRCRSPACSGCAASSSSRRRCRRCRRASAPSRRCWPRACRRVRSGRACARSSIRSASLTPMRRSNASTSAKNSGFGSIGSRAASASAWGSRGRCSRRRGLWLIDEPLSALDPTRASMAIETLDERGARARRHPGRHAAPGRRGDAVSRASSGLRDGELAFDLPARAGNAAASRTPVRAARARAGGRARRSAAARGRAAAPAPSCIAADGAARPLSARPRCTIRRGRAGVFWMLAALALIAPALWATEFKPWIMFEPESLRSTWIFITGFFPPRLDREFLVLMAWETWRTVAIATCGMTLALLLAFPLTLASTAALSVSALPGRMNALPFVVRQARAVAADPAAERPGARVGARFRARGRPGPDRGRVCDRAHLCGHARQGLRGDTGERRHACDRIAHA